MEDLPQAHQAMPLAPVVALLPAALAAVRADPAEALEVLAGVARHQSR